MRLNNEGASEGWVSAAIRAGGSARRLAAGDALFRRGDKAVGVFEVLSGRLRMSLMAANGRELVVQTASAGHTMAESSLFAEKYQYDAIALTDCDVTMYPKSVLFAEFSREPQRAFAFMAALAEQIVDLRSRLERHHLRSARDRVRHYLANNVRSDGRTVAIDGSLKDLALDLGLTHEALYRAIGELEAAGEIERSKRQIRLGGSV